MRSGALGIQNSSGAIQSDEEAFATTKRLNYKYFSVSRQRKYRQREEIRNDEDECRNNEEAVFIEDSRDEEECDEREGPPSRNIPSSRELSCVDNSMEDKRDLCQKYPETSNRQSTVPPYYYHHHQHNHHHYFAPTPPRRAAYDCSHYNSPTTSSDPYYYPHPTPYSTPPRVRLPRKKRAVFNKHQHDNRHGLAGKCIEFKENSNPQAHDCNPKKQRLHHNNDNEADNGSNWEKDSQIMMDTSSISSEHTPLPKSVTQDDESQVGSSLPATRSFDADNDLMTMIQSQMSWNSNTTTGDVSSIGDMAEWQENDDHSSASIHQPTKYRGKDGATIGTVEEGHHGKDGHKCKSRNHSLCDSTTSSMTTTKTSTCRSIAVKRHPSPRRESNIHGPTYDGYHLGERSRYQYYDNRRYYEIMRHASPVTPVSSYHHPPHPPPMPLTLPPPPYMATPPPRMPPHYWQPYSAATASSPPLSSSAADPMESRKIADHVSTLTPPYPSKLPLSLYKHRCTLLKPPLPSKSSTHQADDDDDDNEDLPCFSLLINYPSVPFNNVKRNTLGFKYCIMCGLACPIRNPTTKPDDKESPRPTIPAQNKGLCTHCDVSVW
eukprot:CAMPEP_0178908168 /NCGR_PEP_ID=MMETSP0786-20121207/7775_1 /TAXON_ID=186022 /ORGANISM="Thalassionema frauenfeldii, Strain CCMP 1798" /LENGTH=603 /DNA_ID=CAMNT_0020580045 /DNA_START=234 /DNA_END=2042 /DNA_ORIENTATION=-